MTLEDLQKTVRADSAEFRKTLQAQSDQITEVRERTTRVETIVGRVADIVESDTRQGIALEVAQMHRGQKAILEAMAQNSGGFSRITAKQWAAFGAAIAGIIGSIWAGLQGMGGGG